ncbi:hypothetical protein KIN20_023076 [Parelaphostrongylus tenuis]|uniref:RRM domain-containing protein n=1 Tax=Parelaphostrongylus tenuis TaxID=148309 RepID=A0AAD5QVN4_PARTN|nr:hypothetical protein KIN20_023076 [Parelaphostrongylus tenuis]
MLCPTYTASRNGVTVYLNHVAKVCVKWAGLPSSPPSFRKNFGEELDKEKLKKLFAPYGNITRCAVMKGAEGK